MESWLLYEYSMLSVRTAESIYEALCVPVLMESSLLGSDFWRLWSFTGWVWIVPVPGAGGRGLMIQGRRYHHLLGLGGGIISCLGLGLGIIAQILIHDFSPQVITEWLPAAQYDLIFWGETFISGNVWFALKQLCGQKLLILRILYLCCMTEFGFLLYFANGADT